MNREIRVLYTCKSLVFLITYLLFGVLLLALSSLKVHAVNGEIDDQQPDDAASRLVVSGPSADFGGVNSISLLYSAPLDNTTTVTLTSVNPGGISTFFIGTLSGDTCSNNLGLEDTSVSSGDSLTTSSASSQLVDGRSVYCIQVSATATASDVPYYLTASAGAYIGNVTGDSADKTTGTGYLKDDTPNSSGSAWTKRLTFKPPCLPGGSTFVNARIGLYDIDIGNNLSWTQGTITVRLYENGVLLSGETETYDNSVVPNYSEDNFPKSGTFAFRRDRVYRIEISNINDVNAIKIALPFSQYDALRTCSSPESGKMSCSAFGGLTSTTAGGFQEVTFSIYNDSNFNWVASGRNYDIGVVRDGFVGAYANDVASTFPWYDSQGIGPPDHNSSTYLENRDGDNNDFGSESYNRTNRTGPNNATVHRYATTINIPSKTSRQFSVYIRSPAAGGSQQYGIRMLSRDSRFAPWAWMDWSSSCRFTVTTPSPPVASCSASNVTGFVNETINFSASVTTSGSATGYTLKGHHRINSGAYTGWGNISGSIFTGSTSFSSAGSRTITIQVGYFRPSTASSPTANTTDECTLTVTVNNRAVTCANTTADSWVGQSNSYSVTLTNTGNGSVTVAVAISASGGSVSPTSRSVTIPANDTRTASTTGTANSSTGTFTITWSVTTPSGGSARTCTTTITKHAAPTCSVSNTTFQAGVFSETSASLQFAAGDSWRGNSPGGVAINLSSNQTRYRYNDGTNGATINAPNNTYSGRLSGSRDTGSQATRTSSSYISLSGSSRTANQIAGGASRSTRFMRPGAYGTSAEPAVTWTLDWRDGGYNPPDLQCDENIEVTILALTCTPTTNEFSRNTPGNATTTIVNPNPAGVVVDVRVGGAGRSTFDATGATPDSGDVEVVGTFGNDVDGGGTTNQKPFQTEEITYTSTGTYEVEWDINTEFGVSGYSANPTSAGCANTTIIVAREPYMRLYGNDVVAGATLLDENIASTCTPNNDVGIRSVASTSSGFYSGSAAELAALATGTISDFLPGTGSYRESGGSLRPATLLSSDVDWATAQGSIDYLALGGGGIGLADVGGNYSGGGLCDVIFPDVSEWNQGGPILSDGRRTRSSNVSLSSTTIGTGDRVSLYVTGNVTINGSITYDNPNSWSDEDEVSLLRIYATGNIYIKGAATELDGLYVANGVIVTCEEFQETTNAAVVAGVVSACGDVGGSRNLTVRGALVANDIIFGRISGDIGDSNADPASNPETRFGGGVKAEIFDFLPELYIAFWEDAGDAEEDGVSSGDPTGVFDYISSPPPVF